MCSPRKAEVKNELRHRTKTELTLSVVTPSGEEPRGFYLQGANINIMFETF